MKKDILYVSVMMNFDWLKGFLDRGNDTLPKFRTRLIETITTTTVLLTPCSVKVIFDDIDMKYLKRTKFRVDVYLPYGERPHKTDHANAVRREAVNNIEFILSSMKRI